MSGTTVSSRPGEPAPVGPMPVQPPPKETPESESSADSLISAQADPSDIKLRRLPSWIVSTVVHGLIFLILSLWTYRNSRGPEIALQGRIGEPSPVVSFQMAQSTIQNQNVNESQAEQTVSVQVIPRTFSSSQSPVQTAIASQLTPQQQAFIATGGTPQSMDSLILPGGGLEGRNPEGREKYGDLYGATDRSEQAVDRALQWIIDHQRDNGSWSFNLELDPCNGRCRHSKNAGDTPTPSTGATGLALLALLGAGHTHKTGPYQDNIRRAIYYLRSVAGETENGLDWQKGSMYGHGIALMALAEACTMSVDSDGKYDSDLYELVRLGSVFTATAQHPNGSWGYVPGSPGDTTLTGWQVLSLVAVRRNEIYLPTLTLPRAKQFLTTVVGNDEFEFGYQAAEPEPTTTAIGLTLMLYLGHKPGITFFDESLDRLARRGPTLTNVYHDYYATLALHHARHRDWEKWNTRLREHLIRTQSSNGHESGSWHFKDRWGDKGGRLYTTCMCTMILEVYYRYLPLYDPRIEFPL